MRPADEEGTDADRAEPADGPGAATDPFGTADRGRYTRKLRLLRRTVLFFLSAMGLLFLFWPTYELLLRLPSTEAPATRWLGPEPPLWPSIAALAVGAVGTVLGWRMTWERVNGRAVADPRLYWGCLGVLVLMCLLLEVPFYVFSACASAWCLLVFMAPLRRTLWLTPALVLLGWGRLLFDPAGYPPALLVPDFVFAVLAVLVIWIGCVATFWMWDATREAVEGSRARSLLAVNEERLRFAEDIRGLVGSELSTLAVSADRAGRLLRTDPEAARRRIDLVHESARGSLQRVRSVVRGYRELNLETEVGSVRAVLEQNKTVTTVSGLRGLELPRETAALVAWVVREGGTNVLRHSTAHHCRLVFSVVEADGASPRRLVVEMTNDGVEPGTKDGAESTSGLSGLAERVEGAGGSLEATGTDDGGFRLRTVLPLPSNDVPGAGARGEGVATALEGAASTSPSAHPLAVSTGTVAGPVSVPAGAPTLTRASVDPERRADRRYRITRMINFVLLGLIGLSLLLIPLVELVLADDVGASPATSLAAAGFSVPNVLLLILMLRARLDGDRAPSPKLYWTSLGLLAVTAVLLDSPVTTLNSLAFWWSIGVLLAPRRTTVAVSVVLLLSPILLLPTYGFAITNLPVYGVVWVIAIVLALSMASTTLLTVWLWDVSREAVLGQEARARLAVTEERLRFARDMHDLLGHSLSALAVKAQLAGRLMDRAPDRAAAELAEVQDLARKALGQVRSAVSGDRAVDLDDEIASVVSVLQTRGTRTTVTGLDGGRTPPRVAELAAWVVREGGTNVLRHSDAEECQITFTRVRGDVGGPHTLVVEMHNDRAGGSATDANGGNGLTGLAERLSASGGTVSGSRTREGGFLLRAVLPL
ncbi:histidine kinase [Nocardiopsis sp. MG754419]|nr:histidine kinase [Nocardiopsis sp. MG754419]